MLGELKNKVYLCDLGKSFVYLIKIYVIFSLNQGLSLIYLYIILYLDES